MNRGLVSYFLALSFSLACSGAFAKSVATKAPAKGDAAVAKTVEIDPTASSVVWLGKKVTGQHTGSIKIKGGTVEVKGSEVTGGKFEIDMTTLVDEDLKDAEYNTKLITHLKSDDFFSIEKNPTVSFKITSIKPLKGQPEATHEVVGDLTIKGITNSLSFPAKITGGKDKFQASAKQIAVDRTKWNIKYNSGKFFPNLGDKVINDNFWLDINLVTK